MAHRTDNTVGQFYKRNQNVIKYLGPPVGLFFRPMAPGVIKGTVNKILKFSPFYLSVFLSFYILSFYQEKQKKPGEKKERSQKGHCTSARRTL